MSQPTGSTLRQIAYLPQQYSAIEVQRAFNDLIQNIEQVKFDSAKGHLHNGLPGQGPVISASASISLANTLIFVGNASGFASPVAMSGEASIANTGAVTLLNSAVMAKVLTGYSIASGNISAGDSILSAFNKIGYDKHVAVTIPTTFGLTLTGQAISLSTGYVIPTTTEESNWNTAYGWGNHASAGYVTGTPWTSVGYYKSGDNPVFAGVTVGNHGVLGYGLYYVIDSALPLSSQELGRFTIKSDASELAYFSYYSDFGTPANSYAKIYSAQKLVIESSNFNFNGTTLSIPSATISGLTITRIPFASTGGLLVDDANFAYTQGTGTLKVGILDALNGGGIIKSDILQVGASATLMELNPVTDTYRISPPLNQVLKLAIPFGATYLDMFTLDHYTSGAAYLNSLAYHRFAVNGVWIGSSSTAGKYLKLGAGAITDDWSVIFPATYTDGQYLKATVSGSTVTLSTSAVSTSDEKVKVKTGGTAGFLDDKIAVGAGLSKVSTDDLLTISQTGYTDAAPIGSILPYGGATAPSGYLLCDGASYLKADYTELYAIIGDSFGSADATHFNVPDMKDAFVRGTGTSTIFTDNTKGVRSTSKTGGASSGVGSKQEDAEQGHRHVPLAPQSDFRGYYNVGSYFGGTGNANWNGSNTTGDPTTDGTNGTPRTAPETRPKNIETSFIIKASNTITSLSGGIKNVDVASDAAIAISKLAGGGGLQLVSKTTVTAGTSVSISGLATGEHYILKFWLKQNTASGTVYYQYNGDTGARYLYAHEVSDSSGSRGNQGAGGNQIYLQYSNQAVNVGAEIIGEITFKIWDSDSTIVGSFHNTSYYNSGGVLARLSGSGLYDSGSTVSSIGIFTSGGTFTGTLYLYKLV